MTDPRTQAIARRLHKMNTARDFRDLAAHLERNAKKLREAADAQDLEVDEIARAHGLGIYAVPTPQGPDGQSLDVGIAYQCRS